MSTASSPRRRAAITSVGHYVPDRILSNADLERLVDTSDEWIVTRTGIRERRILDAGATSDLAAPAVEMALRERGMSAAEIEVIIVCTVTPDMFFPATACLLQQKVGARRAWGFDLSAACSGFLYGLTVGSQFIESGAYSRVLVVGADKMSSIVDYKDRNTAILFGDAAGAVLLEPAAGEGTGILDHRLYCDGTGAEALYMKGGGSLNPPSHATVDQGLHFLYQDGRTVFKVAVIGMADVAAEVLERNGLTGEDISWLVPHQANLRIIDACAARINLDPSKVMVNIDRYGNTTAATIPLCLSEWWQAGKLRRGQKIILASFGAGYTWGGMLVSWSAEDRAGVARG